jgi:hypothetical protein
LKRNKDTSKVDEMDKDIEITLKSLLSRNINGVFATDSEDAKNKIIDMIPKRSVVGIGDSTTVRQIGIKEELRKRGIKVLDGFNLQSVYANVKDWEELTLKPVMEATICDIFLTGTNVVTQDGRLLNVDGLGNRVAGMFWGHPRSIIVVGRNKVVKNIDEAFYRLRKVIAPNHLKVRATLKGDKRRKPPCVVEGKCYDCRTKERACNIFTIIEGKPLRTDINLIIVDEDLGLGWDESWPQERIEKIIEEYKKFVWNPSIKFP